MYKATIIAALLAAAAEARFGQEQGNGAITAISALSDLGNPGEAATLAGGSIQFLLAAANPCAKLQQADKIVAALGTSDRAIAAARGLVAAEQNFNPFVASTPSICSDASLPATAELRGVVPLVDPAVTGQDVENANSKTSITTPFSANGLSVAQVMAANGFSNFTAVALDGTKTNGTALGTATGSGNNNNNNNNNAGSNNAGSNNAGSNNAGSNNAGSNNAGSKNGSATADAAASATSSAANIACNIPPATTLATMVSSAAATSAAATAAATAAAAAAAAGACAGSGQTLACSAPAAGAGAVTDATTGNFNGFVASTISGLDFGLCVPTMKFEAGLNGRKDTEFAFQAIDPQVNKGQQEALNPAIIANRIKDQMSNVCGANQAAKDAVVAAQAQLVAAGTRDQSTADTWNTALGFAGTNTNPDNAPQTGLVGHT